MTQKTPLWRGLQTTPQREPSPDKPATTEPEKIPASVAIDKEKRTVTIPCAVAPRKLPNLNEVYPIEVVATYPAPKGQKAHETIVTFSDIKPSHVHQALEQLGLQPGKPARGEGAKATGPAIKVYLELPGPGGQPQRVPIEKMLVDRKTGQPPPAFTWRFTGSALKQPDPEKDDKIFGADLTGTLIAIFPVTDDTVLQTDLTMKDEGVLKLEIAKDALPKEGTPLKLIIEANADDKKEPETKSGTVVGILTAKTENAIDVQADGEEKARRYVPQWVGGAPAQGGGFDKEMLKTIKELKVGSRVRVEWKFEERPRVVKVEVLKAPKDK